VLRTKGYVAISDYAIVGDGRTAALVARDGSIDWLCLPDLDSGSVFAALLDPDRGGAFRLAPVEPFSAERRYVPETNVLETTFTTATGSVRVTDAMLLADGALAPLRELVRRSDGLSGRVELAWTVAPRFGYSEGATRIGTRAGVPVATSRGDARAVLSFDAGEPHCSEDLVHGRLVAERARGACWRWPSRTVSRWCSRRVRTSSAVCDGRSITGVAGPRLATTEAVGAARSCAARWRSSS
jgi:GH15 family glucan-1,4-alpha-glucosidase